MWGVKSRPGAMSALLHDTYITWGIRFQKSTLKSVIVYIKNKIKDLKLEFRRFE